MSYDVVTCGFASAPLPWLGKPARSGLPDPGDPAFLDVAFTALDGLDHDNRVLLLFASGARPGHVLRVLRGALRNPSVVPVGVSLPITGLAATASWLEALADRDVSAGAVTAALRTIAAHLPSYAVTTSVAGLEMPEVRLRHHMMSWLPGTVFSISMSDATTVEVGALGSPQAPPSGAATLVSAGDERLAGRLGASFPSDVERVVLAEEAGHQMWRKARFYEHTVVPHDIDDFAERLRSASLARCPQCGDTMKGHCSFCLAQEGALA